MINRRTFLQALGICAGGLAAARKIADPRPPEPEPTPDVAAPEPDGPLEHGAAFQAAIGDAIRQMMHDADRRRDTLLPYGEPAWLSRDHLHVRIGYQEHVFPLHGGETAADIQAKILAVAFRSLRG